MSPAAISILTRVGVKLRVLLCFSSQQRRASDAGSLSPQPVSMQRVPINSWHRDAVNRILGDTKTLPGNSGNWHIPIMPPGVLLLMLLLLLLLLFYMTFDTLF